MIQNRITTDWNSNPMKVRQHELTQVVKGVFKCVGFLVTQSFFFFSSFEKDFSGLLQFPPEYCKSSAPHTHKDEYMDLTFLCCVVSVQYLLHNAFDKRNDGAAHSWEKINCKWRPNSFSNISDINVSFVAWLKYCIISSWYKKDQYLKEL